MLPEFNFDRQYYYQRALNEEQAFLASYDLAPPLPPPTTKRVLNDLWRTKLSWCMIRISKLSHAKSYDREKVWPSICHSKLSDGNCSFDQWNKVILKFTRNCIERGRTEENFGFKDLRFSQIG